MAPCTSKLLLSAGKGGRLRPKNQKLWNSNRNLAALSSSMARMGWPDTWALIDWDSLTTVRYYMAVAMNMLYQTKLRERHKRVWDELNYAWLATFSCDLHTVRVELWPETGLFAFTQDQSNWLTNTLLFLKAGTGRPRWVSAPKSAPVSSRSRASNRVQRSPVSSSSGWVVVSSNSPSFLGRVPFQDGDSNHCWYCAGMLKTARAFFSDTAEKHASPAPASACTADHSITLAENSKLICLSLPRRFSNLSDLQRFLQLWLILQIFHQTLNILVILILFFVSQSLKTRWAWQPSRSNCCVFLSGSASNLWSGFNISFVV